MITQETERTWRPFDQGDYFRAKQAFSNMVELGLMTPEEADRNLQRLAEATQ